MRVTSNGFSDNLVTQLNQLLERQQRLQAQASSGQKLTLPEDSPGGIRRVLDWQTESKSIEQYRNNISRLKETATTSLTAIQGFKKISNRAGEIAVLADDLKSPTELNAYAKEVGNMIKQAVELANSKERGNYVFGGTNNNTPPFVATTNADGIVTGVSYQGNNDLSEIEISPGTTMTTQSLGANDSGSGPRGLITDNRSGADFLNHLISLQNNLLSGNVSSIASTDRGQLAKDEENILYHVATNGALQSRLESTDSRASQRQLSLSSQVSGEANVDLAQTLVQLSQSQTAYQAALQSGAKLMSTSLLDYLN